MPTGLLSFKELDKLRQVINAREIALLYGNEGMGRTALLKQAANSEATRAFPDGVLYMEGVDESGLVLSVGDIVQRIFDRSHESEPRLKVDFNEAQPYLSNLKALVILNGLGFPASSFAQVADLFSLGAVLIESEHPLGSEIMDEVRLGPLPRQEALELLAAKAGLKQPEDSRESLDEMCALLADVPLAIVIAAKAIRENQLPLENALTLLQQIKTRPGDDVRGGIERDYGLARSTLSELEQQWLTATAFAPGISVEPKYLHEMAADPATAEHTQNRM